MRILLYVQYLGTNYSGWQTQLNKNSVQDVLNEAIYLSLGEKVDTFASSRTDAGVHAYALPVHFDTTTNIPAEKIYLVINQNLPNDIRVLSSKKVSDTFNARFDVIKKTYEYNFYNSDVILPLLDVTATQIFGSFDYIKASSCCKYFVGEHDFKAFCSAGNQTKTTIRTIYDIDLIKTDLGYKLVITGNGFLYNMVRIIAGTIISVGQGALEPNAIPDIIASKDRKKAGKTAAARGLVLKEVFYSNIDKI